MATSLTFLGDLSYGLMNPSISLYSNPGLVWSARELKQVRALRATNIGDTPGRFCKICDRLHEQQVFEKFEHQPGYRALAISASNCSLCYLLLLSLDRRIPSWISDDNKTQNIDEPALQDVTDRIEIIGLPANPSARHGYLRFIVTWRATGFQWSGELFGIYKQVLGDAPATSIWTSSDSENFDARFPVVEDWVQNCQDHHQSCASTKAPNLPTRVLDVEDSRIRLVSSLGKEFNYVALSHCWGGVIPLTTAKATLAARMQQIEFSELPKTFQETVEIVRRLNIRYLWIDTLCIIQDDLEDWERESSKMCQIYQEAFLTIAASAADDCHSGLIQRFVPSYLGTYGDDDTLLTSIRLGNWNSAQRKSPLESRAWALQEDLLSRRVICFASPQLLWRCKEAVMSEDGLLDGIEWEETMLVKMRKRFAKVNNINLSNVYEIWRQLTETYSARNLTFEKDKLPALAGITEYFKNLLKDEPIVGLWANDFVAGLLWKVKNQAGTRSSVLGLPSWSWMSITGGISYAPSWDIGTGDGGYFAKESLEICSASTTWSGIPSSSALQQSKLVVRGFVLRTSFTPDFSYSSQYVHLKREEKNGKAIGGGFLDLAVPNLQASIWCLHLATVVSLDLNRHSSQHGTFIVMLLLPVEGLQHRYRRIGLTEISSGIEEGTNIVSFKQTFGEAEEITIELL